LAAQLLSSNARVSGPALSNGGMIRGMLGGALRRQPGQPSPPPQFGQHRVDDRVMRNWATSTSTRPPPPAGPVPATIAENQLVDLSRSPDPLLSPLLAAVEAIQTATVTLWVLRRSNACGRAGVFEFFQQRHLRGPLSRDSAPNQLPLEIPNTGFADDLPRPRHRQRHRPKNPHPQTHPPTPGGQLSRLLFISPDRPIEVHGPIFIPTGRSSRPP